MCKMQVCNLTYNHNLSKNVATEKFPRKMVLKVQNPKFNISAKAMFWNKQN